MTEVRAEQALYGYRNGHELIYSSIAIDSASDRALSAATDMSFAENSSHYTTLLPLPQLGYFAFARTWPAAGWTRPGAVWSHVLLVDFATLGRVKSWRTVDSIFRDPNVLSEKTLAGKRSVYEKSLTFATIGLEPLVVKSQLINVIMSSLYGTEDPVIVQSRENKRDDLLISLLDQQWPKLRRSFAGRTRARSSRGSFRRFDIELVDRDGSTQNFEIEAPWVNRLASELLNPDTSFRDYLRRYGVESASTRSDMRRLTAIYSSLTSDDPLFVARTLRDCYPRSKEMSTLKVAILQKSDSPSSLWPVSESVKIAAILESGTAVDFVALDLGSRLISLPIGQHQLSDLTSSVSLEAISTDQIEWLIKDVVERADTAEAIRLATSLPDLGILIASRKPEILSASRLWSQLDSELLSEITLAEGPAVVRAVWVSLARASESFALAQIAQSDGRAWWIGTTAVAMESTTATELLELCNIQRVVLARVGVASLEAPDSSNVSLREAAAILLAADLASGLWRRFPADTWQRLAENWRTDDLVRNLPTYAIDRVFSVALLSGSSSGDSSLRSSAWETTFARLHDRLEDPHFDGESWEVLANALPEASDWDRCERLRLGLVRETRRDDWTSAQIGRLLLPASPNARKVERQLAQIKPRKRQSLLRELLRQLFS